MKSLQIYPLQTPIFKAKDDLTAFIVAHTPREIIGERMVLAITSKIVSLAENRLVPQASIDKGSLVRREADVYLGEIGYGCHLTVKDGLFIPSAGIDESNSQAGDFILYPKDPMESARKLWENLRSAWNLDELGILLTDSHTSPLRQGVTGICLSYWGFHAVRSMIGSQDLFGRELKMTKMNYADGLSSAAVLMMGEGSESQPLALIKGADLDFCQICHPEELRMPLAEDLYYPMIKNFLPKK